MEEIENKIRIQNKTTNKISSEGKNSTDVSVSENEKEKESSETEDSSFKLADQQACASMTALLKVRTLVLIHALLNRFFPHPFVSFLTVFW